VKTVTPAKRRKAQVGRFIAIADTLRRLHREGEVTQQALEELIRLHPQIEVAISPFAIDYKDLSPEGRRRSIARAYANVYQRRGKLKPQPCEDCGGDKVEKHHADYSKPLAVTWLCRRCHLSRHRATEVSHGTSAEGGVA